MKLRNILGVSALTLLLGVSVSGVSSNAADTTPDKTSDNEVSGNINADKYLNFNGVSNVNKSGSVDITSKNGGDTTNNRKFIVSGKDGMIANISNNTGHTVPSKLTVSESTTKSDGKTSVPSSIYESKDNLLNGGEVQQGNNVNPNIGSLSIQIAPSAQISNEETFKTNLTWTLTNAQEPTNNGGQK